MKNLTKSTIVMLIILVSTTAYAERNTIDVNVNRDMGPNWRRLESLEEYGKELRAQREREKNRQLLQQQYEDDLRQQRQKQQRQYEYETKQMILKAIIEGKLTKEQGAELYKEYTGKKL